MAEGGEDPEDKLCFLESVSGPNPAAAGAAAAGKDDDFVGPRFGDSLDSDKGYSNRTATSSVVGGVCQVRDIPPQGSCLGQFAGTEKSQVKRSSARTKHTANPFSAAGGPSGLGWGPRTWHGASVDGGAGNDSEQLVLGNITREKEVWA